MKTKPSYVKTRFFSTTGGSKLPFNLSCLRLLAVLILTGSFNLYSQSVRSGMIPIIALKGFIISHTGDITWGKIRYNKFTENYMSQITFIGQDKVKTVYNAANVKGMGINTQSFTEQDADNNPACWDYYECRHSPKKGVMVFMNRFEAGRITVFADNKSMRFTNQTVETKSKIRGISLGYSGDEGLQIGPDIEATTNVIKSKTTYSSYYFEKDGGALTKVDKGNYDKLWPQLFADCPWIAEQANKTPELKAFKSILRLVELYNQVCEK
ncbi:MAG: hypothetical protein Q8904_08800 [Bacteroidota bacterium]|nr:hypothetical protein [Bacteroidota bacterium]